MNGRTDDTRLKQSMKIILQPVLAEEEAYIRTMRAVSLTMPASLRERLQSLLDSHTQKPHPKPYRMVWKRAVIIAAVLLMLALAACMAIEPLREKVFGFFVTWYDAYFELRVDSPDTEAAPITQPLGTFHYIPEGYEIVEDRQAGDIRQVVFQNADGNIICFNVDLLTTSTSYDIKYEIENEYINGWSVAVLPGDVSSGRHTFAVWSDENYKYELSGVIQAEELMKMVAHLE